MYYILYNFKKCLTRPSSKNDGVVENKIVLNCHEATWHALVLDASKHKETKAVVLTFDHDIKWICENVLFVMLHIIILASKSLPPFGL